MTYADRIRAIQDEYERETGERPNFNAAAVIADRQADAEYHRAQATDAMPDPDPHAALSQTETYTQEQDEEREPHAYQADTLNPDSCYYCGRPPIEHTDYSPIAADAFRLDGRQYPSGRPRIADVCPQCGSAEPHTPAATSQSCWRNIAAAKLPGATVDHTEHDDRYESACQACRDELADELQAEYTEALERVRDRHSQARDWRPSGSPSP